MQKSRRWFRWLVRAAELLPVPVSFVAGLVTVSPAAQAQVVPTVDGAGTTVAQEGDQYDISGGTQAGGNLFHEFDDFSLTAAETANFLGDSGVFNIVGQVSAANPSYIDGQVQVSGTDADLYLINPSGVFFGADATLSLGGSFTATTADQVGFGEAWLDVFSEQNDYTQLTAEPSSFQFTAEAPSAVINQGDLAVVEGESLVLMGGHVLNDGGLDAPGGEIGLVAVGGESTVRFGIPGSLLSLEIAEQSVPLRADASLAQTDLPALITGGTNAVADSLDVGNDGVIRLNGFPVEPEEVVTTGEISTRSLTGDGGTIALLGGSVDVLSSVIDASGENGGTVLVGRGLSEQASFPMAGIVISDQGSVIRADGVTGAGGNVVVGANWVARVFGTVSAQGATQGGLIETSAENLNLSDVSIEVGGQSEGGGRWLTDSADAEIVSGTFDFDAFNQIDPTLIVSTLDSGADVDITTTSSSSSGDISLLDSIAQTGASTADLTLTGRRFSTDGAKIDLASTGTLTFGLNMVNAELTPDSSSIESAITAIGDVNGDRLLDVWGGLYDFSGALDVNTQVEIQGAGVDGTRFQDTSGDRLFNILAGGDLRLRDLGLTKSPAGPALGGGITNNGGALTITDTVLFKNAADNGGAIEVSNGGLLSIISSTLHQNTAVGSGGGIQLQSGSSATVVDTVFAGNLAGENGGGIDATSQVDLVLEDVIVVGNTADSQGGGVYAQDATVDITNGSFLNNSATNGGGLQVREASTLVVAGSSFTNNSAIDGEGGAIAVENSEAALQSVEIFDNTATTQGGGIAQRSGTLVLNASDLRRNEAGFNGGAIAISEVATTTLEGSTLLIDNEAGVNGGGLATKGTGSLNIEDAFWRGNQAGGSGGALYQMSSGSLAIESMGFQGNTAGVDGGALSLSGGGAVTINNATINENEAGGNGGGVHLTDGGSVTLTRAAVLDNVAGNDGGGLYQAGSSELVGDTANLRDNRAGNDGGAIASNTTGGRLVWSDANVIGNAAVNNGGAIVVGGETTVDLSGLLFRSNEADMGVGGALAVGDDASLSVLNVSFETNRAATQGGAIYADSTGAADVTSGIFLSNEATDDGGAIYNAGDLTLDSVVVEDNATQADGGGLFNTGNVSIVDSRFEGNQAAVKGGGLASARALMADGLDVIGNTAQNGGGLYLQGGAATVADSVFEGNQATDVGGGISALSANLTLHDTALNENQANGDGGGVRLYDSAATIETTEFTANQALWGAGLEMSVGSEASLRDSAFTQNQATLFGGGVQVDDTGRLNATGVTFEANRASSGGGLFNRGTSTLVNTTFSGNVATDAGGAISNAGPMADLTLQNSTLTLNQAGNAGGGIEQDGTQATHLVNSIVAANSSALSADVHGLFLDGGHNLIGQVDGGTGFTSSTLVGTAATPIDPELAPLADNGGATLTHQPLATSVAVNAGQAHNTLPAQDQRSGDRLVGQFVDIGSVELAADQLLPPVEPPVDPPVESPVDPVPEDEMVTVPADVLTPILLSDSPAAGSGVIHRSSGEQPLSADNVAIRKVESFLGQSFQDYWDLPDKADLSFDEVQAVLRRAQDEYAVNSAVVYAVFVPDEKPEENSADILRIEPELAADDLLNLAVVMPEGELVSYELPVTRRDAERQVRMLRSTVADPEDSFGHAPLTQQLYQWLLAPLEEDLAAQGIQNLMYALDRGLRTAPVTAMRDHHGYSLERYGISVVPSMGLMQTDFSDPVRRATVAMGVSEFEHEAPLPAVPIELAVLKDTVPVSQTILNEGSTAAALDAIKILEQPGVLHLATHATFDTRSPESSYIQLWDDPLSMKEFSTLGWQASDLELLILSACSTALSSPNSELGFAGLAAASGVDASVGSLWQVSDVGTLALMGEFYAQLESTDLRFEALRQAQLALLKGETRIEGGNLITSQGEVDLPDEWNLPAEATLDHPFFWSAFTMVGNPW